jgi:hypothetical protein
MKKYIFTLLILFQLISAEDLSNIFTVINGEQVHPVNFINNLG